MPVYAEGFRHQRNCPKGEAERALAAAAGDDSSSETESDEVSTESDSLGGRGERPRAKRAAAKKVCSDRRCCTWFDLANWFGYLPLELPPADFEACFTDVANGGPGLYEKLIVLGGKTLDIMSEMHFYEMYPEVKDLHLPSDLRADKEALRLLWARKRADRITSLSSLFLFGRSYLALAQSLPTRQAVAKYVKACVGYCCQSADTENLYKWMPVLIEHIFWTQKLRTERMAEDNAILQDLQEFLGYKFDHLIPRMRECLEGTSVPQRSDAPTGRELIKLYATDYFTKMSEEAGIEPSRRILWVDQEVDNFLAGPAVPAFASLCMSLGPFVVAVEEGGPTHVQTFTNMFESLVAACWIISTEEKVKIWMPSLIQRLRQTQLLLHMAQMGDKYFTTRAKLRRPAKHPIDPRQIAAANNAFLDPFALWNVDPLRRPLAEAPVEYPPGPLYYPAPKGGVLEAPCTPCCFVPRPAPRPAPCRSNKKGVTLFDAEENKYEFYPLGPQVFPPYRRRQNPNTACSTRDGSSGRGCFSTPRSAWGPRDRSSFEPARGDDVSVQTTAGGHGVDRYSTVAPTWSRYPSQPQAVSGSSWPAPPRPGSVPGRPLPGEVAPAAAAAAAAEPRVKIRYVADEGGQGDQPKTNVEVYVDDVLVHNRPLPTNQEVAGTDFKAVLCTPTGSPVVLNFTRNGEDGRPTVYITEGKPVQDANTFYLQGSSWEAPTSAECGPSPGAPRGPPYGERAAAEEPLTPPSSGCCFAPTCGPRQPSIRYTDSEGPVPVDIMVSPAPPPAAAAAAAAAARRSRSFQEQQEIEPVADTCILGNYLKGCMTPTRSAQTPHDQQVRQQAVSSYTVPRIRAYTNRSGVSG
ncbi:Apicomplexan specific protein, related [Eimeria necatrix]|uniref:Apicomplexan specific protein, related n=1 Tax=Eimeria necatrix TaxID=51315 RepID=U6MFX2_9EIME|nr:Apicomplexan specific protein, related [Eimeria necatrix]CDJ63132.1 Apicomplexan specific protein, related [Eimeria necatrix]